MDHIVGGQSPQQINRLIQREMVLHHLRCEF
jgi:hypothetical protein